MDSAHLMVSNKQVSPCQNCAIYARHNSALRPL